MKFSVRNKLFAGFGAVLTCVAIVSIVNFTKIGNISIVEHRLIDLRQPTVLAGTELTDGIHLSLSGLRGYMIWGKDPAAAEKFRVERLSGWALIDRSLAKMDEFSKNWTNPNNVQKLEEMKALVEEFRVAQQQVEDIAHASENIPAIEILMTEAAPRASKIVQALTTMIDEESKLDATSERKTLLKLLADSRGSFAIGLANIRAYLLSGDAQFADGFKAEWKMNEARFEQISTKTNLFNAKQAKGWATYQTIRAEFASLPPKMFELRASKDWNLANYWIGIRAAPKATAIMKILQDMRASQDKLAATDEELLDDEIYAMEASIILGGLIALVIGVAIAFLISNMITVPLTQVVSRAKSIASGNLNEAALQVKGTDELAETTVAINDMSSNLQNIIRQISKSAEQIGSASEELSAVTTQTSQNILEQQAQTEQVATAMTEMSATVQEVTNSISGSARATEEAELETNRGREVVESAIQAVQQLGGQIENASGVINQLEQESNNITAVLDVIKGVAGQTNLLALNAAIEAARAGEQGRGFAVVADEVRTLAGKTQESTTEINQVIEKLQAGSRRAVEVMNRSSEEAQSVVEQATKAGNSLSVISGAVENINKMSIHIASAAEEQNATAEEIRRNILGISTMASETSAGSQQITVASKDLADLSAGLQKLTSQFNF